MTHWVGFAIEIMVSLLLLLTIGYCFTLNTKLRRLKSDEHALKATIAELITATEIAERAIAGLKVTVRDVDQNIGERLRAAERFSAEIAEQIEAGTEVVDRLARIVAAGRPAAPEPVAAPAPAAFHSVAPAVTAPAAAVHAPPRLSTAPDSRTMLATARALAERSRARATGVAA